MEKEKQEEELDFIDKLKLKTYYLLIGCVSFIALCIMPFIGGVSGDLAFPHGKAQWIVWIFNRVIVSCINVAIFYCFVQQGRMNCLKDKNYIEAVNILREENNDSVKQIRSPKEFLREEYMHKGVSVLVSTITASFALTQMAIQFNVAAMISYFIVIFMGLVFGVLEMKKVEEYWTDEFYKYAKKVEKETNEKKEFLKTYNMIVNNVNQKVKQILKEEL